MKIKATVEWKASSIANIAEIPIGLRMVSLNYESMDSRSRWNSYQSFKIFSKRERHDIELFRTGKRQIEFNFQS